MQVFDLGREGKDVPKRAAEVADIVAEAGTSSVAGNPGALMSMGCAVSK